MKKLLLSTFLCMIGAGSIFAQYCMLPGRTPYSNLQPGITNFKLNTINRNSSNSENPSSVVVSTGLTTTLIAGQTYSISISHSEDTQFFAGDRNNLRVWIDYNSNFSWTDAGETVLTKNFEAPGTTYTANFTVPSVVPTGTYALRATAKMSSDAGHSAPTPCDTPADPLEYHGEMEDYSVVIINSGAPTANFAMSSTVCTNAALTVTNTSAGSPSPTFIWTSTPSAGVVFSPNSTAANPQITFANSGSHTITCIASNSVSGGSANKTVTVTTCSYVGIHENSILDATLISPNPASGILQLKFQAPVQNCELRVLNCLGQTVIAKALDLPENNVAELDLSAAVEGIYIIEISSGVQKTSKRITVNR